MSALQKCFFIWIILLEAITVNSSCPNPRQLMNGRQRFVYYNHKLEVGAKWDFSCRSGFTLIGSPSMTCQQNGRWSAEQPTCGRVGQGQQSASKLLSTSISCPPLQFNPASGGRYIFYNHKYEVGSKVVLYCLNGYNLVGTSEIVCQTNGQWSSKLPHCIKGGQNVQPQPPSSASNLSCPEVKFTPALGGNFVFFKHKHETGAKLDVYCLAGYTLIGSSKLACQANGQWSGTIPHCVKGGQSTPQLPPSSKSTLSCPVLKFPTALGGNRVFFQHKHEIGAKLDVYCLDSYTLVGDSKFTCQTDGQWSGELPTCVKGHIPDTKTVEITCKDPGTPLNARRVPDITNDEYKIGTKFVFTCNGDFNLEGEDTVSCLNTGRWSLANPKCVRKETQSGYPVAVLFCQDPGIPSNAMRTSSSVVFELGAEVSYMCKDGFAIQGSAGIVCMYSGKWSSPAPECISAEIKQGGCTEPEPPQYGNLRVVIHRSDSKAPFRLTTGSLIHYTCQTSFHLHGSETRICLSDGRWSGTAPHCVINCGSSKSTRRPFIINGEISELGQWPWQAGIAISNRSLSQIAGVPKNIIFQAEDDNVGITCGGSLVSAEWVLTAAHCVTLGRTHEKYPLQDVSVYLGKHFRDSAKDDSFVHWSRVTDITINENYDPTTFASDVAMIRMTKLPLFTGRVLPICLPSFRKDRLTAVENGTQGVVSGWGITEGNVPSAELKHGLLAFSPPSDCEQLSLGESPTAVNRVQPDQFCANPVGIDSGYSCFGDSGGPLVYEDTVGMKKRWVIEGIVSWGKKGCALSSSVYIRVHHYLNWLRRFVDIDDHGDRTTK